MGMSGEIDAIKERVDFLTETALKLASEVTRLQELNRELLEALENIRNFMAYKYSEEDPYVMDADKALAKARGE